MLTRTSLCTVLAATTALGLIPIVAPAQQAATPSSPEAAEEIVVTAQKREQNIEDVPMSITALSAAELTRRGASGIEDIQYSVPGLSITEFAPGEQRIELRGVSVYSGLSTVGVYLDELPLNTEINGSGMDVRDLDLSRIEVLRGPQGTLYGQGAMGGTIRYITNDPKLDVYEGEASGEMASIDHGGIDWKSDAVVNLPLVADEMALRLAGSYQDFGGWVDNTTLGKKDSNSGHSGTIRAKLLWFPTDDLKITLMVQHQDLDLDSNNTSDADYKIAAPLSTPLNSRSDLVNLIATYDFGFATLLSSTGYVDRREYQQVDLCGYFIPAFESEGFPPGSLKSIAEPSVSANRIFNQEIRLTSDESDPLSWTVGGMYRNDNASINLDTIVTPNILPFTLADEYGTNPSNSQSWAIFGEATYHVIPSVEATVGLRYFQDHRYQDSASTVFGVSSLDTGSAAFNALTPRFNVKWDVDENLNFYTNVAEGFRSGGFNEISAGQGVVSVSPTYAPDKLWSYEAGAKYQTPDRRFNADLAVYWNDWKNIQSLAFAPGSLATFTTNDGELSGPGIDGQLQYRPMRALTLSLTGGYVNMTYDTTTIEHDKGDPADYVPHYTGSASAEYQFQWADDMPGYVRADYQMTDAFQVFVRDAQSVPAKSDVQRYLNLRVGADVSDWKLSVFTKNVLGENGVVYPLFGVATVPARPEPRTVGIAFARSF